MLFATDLASEPPPRAVTLPPMKPLPSTAPPRPPRPPKLPSRLLLRLRVWLVMVAGLVPAVRLEGVSAAASDGTGVRELNPPIGSGASPEPNILPEKVRCASIDARIVAFPSPLMLLKPPPNLPTVKPPPKPPPAVALGDLESM